METCNLVTYLTVLTHNLNLRQQDYNCFSFTHSFILKEISSEMYPNNFLSSMNDYVPCFSNNSQIILNQMNDCSNLWSMFQFRRPRRRSYWPWSRRGCYPRSQKSFCRRLSPYSAAPEALVVLVQPSKIWKKCRIHFSFKLKEPFLIQQSLSKIVMEFEWSNGGVKFQLTKLFNPFRKVFTMNLRKSNFSFMF